MADDGRLQRLVDQVRWLERHHHLITPIIFKSGEVERRNQLLAKMNWELFDAMRAVRGEANGHAA